MFKSMDHSTRMIRNRIRQPDLPRILHPRRDTTMTAHGVITTFAQLAFHFATGVTKPGIFQGEKLAS